MYLYLLCFELFVLRFCIDSFMYIYSYLFCLYRGADKSLARPGRKQVTETEDFDFHISYS